MEKITKQQCEEFKKKPNINPLTGRKIQIGKITHIKLSKACNSSHPKKPDSSSKKNKYIPPLGPMIYWTYNTSSMDEKIKNAFTFIKFLQKKYHELRSDDINVVSQSEINDYIEMSNNIADLNLSIKLTNVCLALREEFIKMKKSKKLIRDQPKHDVFEVNGKPIMEIKPNRTFNRSQVAFVYNFYKNLKSRLEKQLIEKSNLAIAGSHVDDLANHKKYLDYLIKKKLFTYDDIYKHTFQNENFPQEIEVLYKQYREKYFS